MNKIVISILSILLWLQSDAQATEIIEESPQVIEQLANHSAFRQYTTRHLRHPPESQVFATDGPQLPDLPGQKNLKESKFPLVVFAIVGLFLIIIWIPYILKYLYDVIRGIGKRQPWVQLDLRSIRPSWANQHDTFQRKGQMLDVRAHIGLHQRTKDKLSLSMAIGHLWFKDTNLQTGAHKNWNDYYFLFGPALIWDNISGRRPDYLYLELLGGTSQNENIGLIGQMSLGLNIKMGSDHGGEGDGFNTWYAGPMIGTMFYEVKKDRGLSNEIDGSGYIFGLTVGRQF